MKERITDAMLDTLVNSINERTNSPAKPWSIVDGKNVSNVGNYHLSSAYGGTKLEQMVEGGGVRDVLNTGFASNRELFNRMHAYLNGLRDAAPVEAN